MVLLLAAAITAVTPATELFARGSPAIRVFAADDGLPPTPATALARDSEGRVWVGTQTGLYAGDGRGFHAVALPGEDVSRSVQGILPRADGSLWIATAGSGVLRLAHRAWTRFDAGLPSPNVHALAELQGTLWAATPAGLARLAGERWEAVAPLPAYAGTGVWTLLGTADALYAGTEAGLLRLRGGVWTALREGLPDEHIRALLQSRGGALYIGTERGLAALDHEKIAPVPDAGGAAVYALAETADGALWAGHYPAGGLVRLQGGHARVFDSSSGLDDMVSALLATVAPSGAPMLWAGCAGGLTRVVDGAIRAFPSEAPLREDVRFGIATIDDGPSRGVWVVTVKGLFRFVNGRWADLSPAGDRALSLAQDTDGAVLVGTIGGQLLRFDGRALRPLQFPVEAGNDVRAIAARPGELWVARKNGLVVRRGGKWSAYGPENSGLKGNWHLAIAFTRSSAWVGGWAGLARFDGERFTAWDKASGLPGDVVDGLFALERNGREELWVAMPGAGAMRVDPARPEDRLVFSERSSAPLPSDVVRTISAGRDGAVYVCTERGVARLEETKDGWRSQSLNREDGLPGLECSSRSAAVDSAGRIWLGTASGTAVVDPAPATASGPLSPLVVERTLVRGRDEELSGRTLRRGDDSLLFEYGLLGYFRADETRYRTQLAGLEDAPTGWTADAKREFPTLPAGKYEFRIWARDYAGRVTGPVTRAFRIARPPWLSAWAIAAYVALLGAALAGLTHLRTLALHRRAERLEREVSLRTKQLAEKNRELSQTNAELSATYRDMDRIFAALAEALEGKVLDGRYRLEERIGSGGFGAVFRATDLQQGLQVAVKVFRPHEQSGLSESLERFRQEARAAQRIRHPNAVIVHGDGVTSEGVVYIVMELLRGTSLKDLLREGPMAPQRAAAMAAQVLAALAEAHRHGMVHRDVKPENVFVEPGDHIKVLDFGIAKVKDAALAGQSLTMTGALVGTPTYMAPERLENKPYDGRADVYSVGVMLYEMVTGRPPFVAQGESLWSLILAHVNQPPRGPREIDPSISAELSDAILSALAKRSDERPSAEALGARLSGPAAAARASG